MPFISAEWWKRCVWRGLRKCFFHQNNDEFISNQITACLIASICTELYNIIPGCKVGRMHTILSLPRYSCQFPFLHSHAIHACINGFSSVHYSILFASLIEFYSISVVYGISALVEFPFNRKCIVTISFSDEKKRVFVLFDVCRQSKMDFPWQTFSSLKYTRSYRHKVSISYSSHRTVQYNAHDGLKFEHLCQCQSYCVAMRLCVCAFVWEWISTEVFQLLLPLNAHISSTEIASLFSFLSIWLL